MLSEKIKLFDIFASRIYLNYKGNILLETVAGGIISIMAILGIIYIVAQ